MVLAQIKIIDDSLNLLCGKCKGGFLDYVDKIDTIDYQTVYKYKCNVCGSIDYSEYRYPINLYNKKKGEIN